MRSAQDAGEYNNYFRTVTSLIQTDEQRRREGRLRQGFGHEAGGAPEVQQEGFLPPANKDAGLHDGPRFGAHQSPGQNAMSQGNRSVSLPQLGNTARGASFLEASPSSRFGVADQDPIMSATRRNWSFDDNAFAGTRGGGFVDTARRTRNGWSDGLAASPDLHRTGGRSEFQNVMGGQLLPQIRHAARDLLEVANELTRHAQHPGHAEYPPGWGGVRHSLAAPAFGGGGASAMHASYRGLGELPEMPSLQPYDGVDLRPRLPWQPNGSPSFPEHSPQPQRHSQSPQPEQRPQNHQQLVQPGTQEQDDLRASRQQKMLQQQQEQQRHDEMLNRSMPSQQQQQSQPLPEPQPEPLQPDQQQPQQSQQMQPHLPEQQPLAEQQQQLREQQQQQLQEQQQQLLQQQQYLQQLQQQPEQQSPKRQYQQMTPYMSPGKPMQEQNHAQQQWQMQGSQSSSNLPFQNLDESRQVQQQPTQTHFQQHQYEDQNLQRHPLLQQSTHTFHQQSAPAPPQQLVSPQHASQSPAWQGMSAYPVSSGTTPAEGKRRGVSPAPASPCPGIGPPSPRLLEEAVRKQLSPPRASAQAERRGAEASPVRNDSPSKAAPLWEPLAAQPRMARKAPSAGLGGSPPRAVNAAGPGLTSSASLPALR
mmetsp:Transcript_82647/g.145827  ORF Transcript_82647/g.145827 Transcript_82647/m.145827 type:complete len:645 (+) Transcript_82647:46-1980(+)